MTDAEKIAEKVGVCRQTVSAVLNGNRRKFSETTRKAILDAAEELGYIPDLNAKAMSGRSVHTIGLIMPSMMSSLGPYLSFSVNAEVTRRGYKCYIISPANAEEESAAVREFIARKFDGIIVCSLFRPFDFERCSIPAAVAGARLDSFEISADFNYGMQLALEHLYREHGHRDIVFLTNRTEGNLAKYEAYRTFVQNAGLRERKILEIANIANPCEEILTLLRDGVTAFAATSDILAGNFINLLSRKGIGVPSDAAVTGYDGLLLSQSGMLQLSAVVHPIQKIAERCVSLLFEKIERRRNGRIMEPERIRPVFFKGQTCGCSGLELPLMSETIQLDRLASSQDYRKYFDISFNTE